MIKKDSGVVTETKLLELIKTNDLKWSANTEYICKKQSIIMWTLHIMKVLDVDPTSICDVFFI